MRTGVYTSLVKVRERRKSWWPFENGGESRISSIGSIRGILMIIQNFTWNLMAACGFRVNLTKDFALTVGRCAAPQLDFREHQG
jgi:hypothetical protein